MQELTNCKNCGAPLQYNKISYGKTAKCNYCNTEYHIDKLGRVEEYKVSLMIMGKVRNYYISSVAVKPILLDCGRSLDSRVEYVTAMQYKSEITLVEI